MQREGNIIPVIIGIVMTPEITELSYELISILPLKFD
jgi:hypothetical protein